MTEDKTTKIEKFIEILPDILKDSYDKATPGWEGSTADMIRATYSVVEVLKRLWIGLSEFFPINHFGGKPANKFIEEYLENRYVWQRALAEPYGAGTGGTIVGPITTMGVIQDMEAVVEQTVLALLSGERSREHQLAWSKRWKEAQISRN
jgi:hypothetical protein